MAQKILLINPSPVGHMRFSREGRCQEPEGILGTVKPPLSLAIIASLFRKARIDFRFIDADARGLSPEKVLQSLKAMNFQPTIVIFMTSTGSIMSDIKGLTNIKRQFQSKLISIYGPGAIVPEETLRRFSVLDAVLIGEPEPTIIKLISQDFAFENIGYGLMYRTDEGIFGNHVPEHMADLDILPLPAWDLVPLEFYRVPLLWEKYALLEINRGCPYNCEFCTVPGLHGKGFRQRSLDLVFEEIDQLMRLGVKTFHLWGDSTTINHTYMHALCQRLIEMDANIKWFSNTRAETLADDDMVALMKKSGCWMLGFGAESGEKETLMAMNKRLTTTDSQIAVNNLRKHKILSFTFLIFGYPGESEEQMLATSNFVIQLDPDFAFFNLAIPYPGTPLYSLAIQKDLIPKDVDWELITMQNYILGTPAHRQTVINIRNKSARRFYLRPAMIKRAWIVSGNFLALAKGMFKGLNLLQNG